MAQASIDSVDNPDVMLRQHAPAQSSAGTKHYWLFVAKLGAGEEAGATRRAGMSGNTKRLARGYRNFTHYRLHLLLNHAASTKITAGHHDVR